jgi:hypothetical protein
LIEIESEFVKRRMNLPKSDYYDSNKNAPEVSQGHEVEPQELDDPRMIRAVNARLENPGMSLLSALLAGGFKFSKKNSIDDALSKNRRGGFYDSDNILRSERQRQLSKRLRFIASCKNKKETQRQHPKRKEFLHSDCSYSSTNGMVDKSIGHNTVQMTSSSSAITNMGPRNPRIRPTSTRGVSSNDLLYGDPDLQAAIQELVILKEQRSLLDRDIEKSTMNMTLMPSSSSTAGITDHFKPVSRLREGVFSNAGAQNPSPLQTGINELHLLQQQQSLLDRDVDRTMVTSSSSFTAEKADHFKDISRLREGFSSNAGVQNPSPLQTGINELHLLQQQQSLLDRDVETMLLSSYSPSATENTSGCFKPTNRLSINTYPTTLQTRPVCETPYQLQKEQISSLSLLDPFDDKTRSDLLWSTPVHSLNPGTTSIPFSTLHHSQNPLSPALDKDNEQSFVSTEDQSKINSSIS